MAATPSPIPGAPAWLTGQHNRLIRSVAADLRGAADSIEARLVDPAAADGTTCTASAANVVTVLANLVPNLGLGQLIRQAAELDRILADERDS
jgi:hypothetical protein